MADKYILRITAGSSYDTANDHLVHVNTPQPVKISSPSADIELNVRIHNYSGLPRNSPETSKYFETAPHDYNKDQYSISFRFTPKKPSNVKDGEEEGISGHDLQFGNDFDRPIRDKLPPGFNTAMNIVRWWIDPGLDGDAYADRPYLYGPALSSFNALHVGGGEYDEEKGGIWIEEGGDEDGKKLREEKKTPATAKGRMKWALGQAAKDNWKWEYGRTYGLDFFNPYIDFSNLAMNLPGFKLPIVRYWDGQGVRYVLRNKNTGEVYLVVLFSLFLKEDINEDGSVKEGAAERAAAAAPAGDADAAAKDGKNVGGEEEHDEEESLRKAREEFGAKHGEETSADDVD